MSTTIAPERIEQVIEAPFIVEGWEHEPQCESEHTYVIAGLPHSSDHPCTVKATHVVVTTCTGTSALWCANREIEHRFDTESYVKCDYCGDFIGDCFRVRSL